MKQILLGAYYFAPMSGVGWMRAGKFAKYLVRHDWQVHVASVDPRHYGPLQAPEADIEAHRSLNMHRLNGWAGLPLVLIKLYYPFFVLHTAWRLRQSLDGVVLFGSPFYSFFWAGLMRRVLGVPVLLDFRDGWSTLHEDSSSGWRARWLNPLRRAIERIGIGSATAGIFATETLREQYVALYPTLASRSVTITNGYDPEDFASLPTVAANQPALATQLGIAGKFLFYAPELGEYLFQALRQLPELGLQYTGEEVARFRALADAAQMGERVQIRESLPYRQVLGQLSQASLCLLSTRGREGLGTKVFDYLALGKPVLCFVPEDSELENQFGHLPSMLFCTAPYTPAKVAQALQQALTLSGIESAQALQGFDREHQALALGEWVMHWRGAEHESAS